MNIDPYDAIQDARSEARYEDAPREEPTLEEIKANAFFACSVDESAGERDKYVGGKR